MSESFQNQFMGDPEFEEDDSIDWGKYLSLIIKNWKRIILISIIFGIVGVGVALMQKKKYQVNITLAPEIQTSSRTGGSLGSLASMLGMNMNLAASSSDAFNIMVFPEIIGSTPFLTQLFEVELTPMPQLPKDASEARNVLNGPLPTVKLYDHLTGRDKEKSWLSKTMHSLLGIPYRDDPNYLETHVNLLTSEQNRVVNFMRSAMVSAAVDKKTAMTTISVRLDDPLMCMQLADTVCQRLRNFVFAYRTEKERKNFDYYDALCDSTLKKMTDAQAAYAASMDNNHSVIMQSVAVRRERLQQEVSMSSQIYQQMVQQRELSRARLQELKPVFAVVEPATFPFKPVNSRRKTVMLFGIFGFFAASIWYLFAKGFCEKCSSKLKELTASKEE